MRGRLLATDLDRTLIPNGAEEESGAARPLFGAFVAARELVLAYVTGRRLELIDEAIEEYELPRPDYALADVGSSLYERRGGDWSASRAWSDWLAEDWGGREGADLAPLFASERDLELQEQEAQRAHKLSFYAPADADADALVARVRALLAREELPSAVVHSIDPAAGVGLVDVLPARSTKARALEFLMSRLGVELDEVVFAGDSGNDFEVLVGPVPAVLVANADDGLRERVVREARAAGHDDRVYAARGGHLGMNGNYAAGILEGWVHFHPDDAERMAELARTNAEERG